MADYKDAGDVANSELSLELWYEIRETYHGVHYEY